MKYWVRHCLSAVNWLVQFACFATRLYPFRFDRSGLRLCDSRSLFRAVLLLHSIRKKFSWALYEYKRMRVKPWFHVKIKFKEF